ncbi:hypothetical protein DAPPUDRAFT_254141 [Daphnia pulex]|uniref:Uncharacterized protein n=1 Tax=Daphnia pulex TaxID=6669 RepID=E9H6D6_DAPPU|nr:hypothetical protein DAPPUDRAFT_254141 [Daphnia pulex]|eukprot:EFX72716.1 hypothetical protein DAPPUDRAFT_254141 [Daphnia pulex]
MEKMFCSYNEITGNNSFPAWMITKPQESGGGVCVDSSAAAADAGKPRSRPADRLWIIERHAAADPPDSPERRDADDLDVTSTAKQRTTLTATVRLRRPLEPEDESRM